MGTNLEKTMSNESVKLLKDLRVNDLKSELEKRGLATSGVKAVLADRLLKHLREQGQDVDTFDFNSPEDQPKNKEDEDAVTAATDDVTEEPAKEAEDKVETEVGDGAETQPEIETEAPAEVEALDEP